MPPRGSCTSPLYRGMTCRCACGTVCPAASPALIPMLYASGWCVDSIWCLTGSMRDHTAACSVSDSLKKSASCLRGAIRVCPGLMGKASGNAAARLLSATTVLDATRSQKTQLNDCVTFRRLPLQGGVLMDFNLMWFPWWTASILTP